VGGCEYGILVEKAGRLRYRARESVEMHEVVMKIDRHAEVKDKVCIVFCKARNEKESCTKFLHTVRGREPTYRCQTRLHPVQGQSTLS
jgi:hypothetical protein